MPQVTTSVADTSTAVFTITNVLNTSSPLVQVFTSAGLPQGWNNVKSLTWTPSFLSISPDVGSQGGTLVTVTGTGFGVNTTGLGLKESGGANLCTEVNVTGYGTFTCLTAAMAVTSVSMTHNAVSYTCTNNGSLNCGFVQDVSSSPQVSSATLSGLDISFAGTNFPDFSASTHTATAIFKGAEAAVASWTGTTDLIATFTNGVPVATAAELAVP